MTQTKITRSFNIPLLDSFLNPIKDKPSDLIEKLVNSVNEIIQYDKTYREIGNYKNWADKYDLLYKELNNKIDSLNNETIDVKLYHIVLLNVIATHEGSKNLFEIETIGKLEKQLNDKENNHTIDVSLAEALFLKKIILDSKIKTSFKNQILSIISDIKE